MLTLGEQSCCCGLLACPLLLPAGSAYLVQAQATAPTPTFQADLQAGDSPLPARRTLLVLLALDGRSFYITVRSAAADAARPVRDSNALGTAAVTAALK